MNEDQYKTPTAEISEANFEAEVLRSKQPVLVEFWAPWSRPCQVLDLVLDELAATSAVSVRIVRVDADNNLNLSLWYEIQSIPTLLYFVDGNVRARVVGTASKEAILAKWRLVFQGDDCPSLASGANKENEHGN
jgi:thioredoxin 1